MEQQDRIMDGDLQTLGLQSILKMLALSGKTGTLFVHSGPETLSISLRKGQIVALREEGVPQPDLLMMLCLVNKLDPSCASRVSSNPPCRSDRDGHTLVRVKANSTTSRAKRAARQDAR